MNINGLIQHGIVGLSADLDDNEDFLVFINDDVSCEDVEKFTTGYGCSSVNYLTKERVVSLKNICDEEDKHFHCLKQDCPHYVADGDNYPFCSATKINDCLSLDYIDDTQYVIKELNNVVVKRKSMV